MKKNFVWFIFCITLISCKKDEIKLMEGTYSGSLVLSTSNGGTTKAKEFEVSLDVEFKGNKYILIEKFYTEKISYDATQKTFRKEEGANGLYSGYFIKDSLFLEFNGGKSGTIYIYKLKKNS